MTGLNRYELRQEEAFAYVYDVLENVNTLSSLVLKSVDFKSGKFFTLLPEDTDFEDIYEFKSYGIAMGVRHQVYPILLNKIVSSDNLSYVFDDFESTFTPAYKGETYSICGLHHESEIYYVISKKNASIELIETCFNFSNVEWHSLCVLSKINLDEKKENKLSLKEMENISKHAQLIMVTAYDGEDCVFWEAPS